MSITEPKDQVEVLLAFFRLLISRVDLCQSLWSDMSCENQSRVYRNGLQENIGPTDARFIACFE